ncbi:rhamnosyltransferase [Clostridium sp. USBA 49]|uniref:glycosyltransferase n=1 Tax=Clostridium sp. USBA 49 TaxID=1881060 RepID=UPI0009996A75|nr:glycosyltransferase [Clostridium sp. USBA 49]SKA87532.1 rhamnosyltransferase [Clostridium sp. USBA 49]
MNICCIIVTYNIDNEFEKCFHAIKDQVDKVIIVDNGSNKDTLNYLDKINGEYNIKLIKNKQNMGIAYALNQGVKYALKNNYDWILTMDDDSEATPNMVSTMINTYNSIDVNEQKNILGIFPHHIEVGLKCNNMNNVNLDKNNELFEYVHSDITSGNLLKRETFDIIGLYNEDLFIDYVDHEFCYRILEKGYKLIKLKNAVLFHRLGNTKQKNFLWKKNNIY